MNKKEFTFSSKTTGWVLFFSALIATFLLGLLASSVMERRAESRARFQLNTPLSEIESDSGKWKANFPREYQRWSMTAQTNFKSKFAGSSHRDALEEQPAMVILWAGYAFAREYNQARGHMHAVDDVRSSLRTGVPQPGTCWTCKSPDVPRLMKEMGISNFYADSWEAVGSNIHGPIGCYDCHNPKTMELQITRPALVEALARRNIDIRGVSHQDMRSLVCAQCHVEYYFRDKTTYYLVFPWDKGYRAEDIEAYYDSNQFYDWVHTLSKAHMLKAQHPDWELAKMGIHAQRGVSCADCHMPYISEGGVKYTDHHVRSPLDNVENTCAVCHGSKVKELVQNVYDRQNAVHELRLEAEQLLAAAHIETRLAIDKGATDAELKPVHLLLRHAQWRWDFVAASIGGSFHAPLECARLLGSAIQKASEARLLIARVLAKHGVYEVPVLPDISSKAKAQAYIKLPMDKLKAEKKEYIDAHAGYWTNSDYK